MNVEINNKKKWIISITQIEEKRYQLHIDKHLKSLVGDFLDERSCNKIDCIAKANYLWVDSYFPVCIVEEMLSIPYDAPAEDGENFNIPTNVKRFAEMFEIVLTSEIKKSYEEKELTVEVPFSVFTNVAEHRFMFNNDQVFKAQFDDETIITCEPCCGGWKYILSICNDSNCNTIQKVFKSDKFESVFFASYKTDTKTVFYKLNVNRSKKLWRSEEHEELLRKPVDVIMFEMQELGNVDIPCTVYDCYVRGKEKDFNEFKKTVDLMRTLWTMEMPYLEMSTQEYREFAQDLVALVEKATNKRISCVLWLGEKPAVERLYHMDYREMHQYEVSDVILSDLGVDGYLFAYEKKPRKLKQEEEN